MIYRNTPNQYALFSSLIRVGSGLRITSGATVRVCKDGTWADGAGTLELDETDQWKYTFTEGETDCGLIAAAVDHAEAVMPLLFSTRTQLGLNTEVVDTEHTWRFEAVDQLTAVNTILEVVGFDDYLRMDLDFPLPKAFGIFSAVLVSGAASGLAIGPLEITSDKRSVLVPVVVTGDGDYILAIEATTNNNKKMVRRGLLKIESVTGT